MKNLKLNINLDVLKIFALVTMTLDHIAKFLLGKGMVRECLIAVGRMSFVIFAFLLMLHLARKNIYKKYIIRLGIFGVVALLVVGGASCLLSNVRVFPLNILISFLVVVLFLWMVELIKNENGPKWVKIMMFALSLGVCLLLSLVCDYGGYGFLFLVLLYCYFKKKNKIILGLILLLSCLINIEGYWWMSLGMTMVLFFNQYEEKNKRIINKWWSFYVYYPLHLLVIFGIKFWL